MSAPARTLARHGMLMAAVLGVIVLLAMFHSVVSTAVEHAHVVRAAPATTVAGDLRPSAALGAKARRAAVLVGRSGD